jgi:two-component system, cell cycle sensor histidine kinase and response regulator CckA
MSVPLTQRRPPAPTILVVEDSDIVRTLTARMLVEQGYPVITAIDGVEAIEVLERASIGVVVTDLRMPRMDGHELARQVAARWPDVQMIFMTGHPEADLTVGLPGPLLMKPFAPDDLAVAVRTRLTALDGGAASA